MNFSVVTEHILSDILSISFLILSIFFYFVLHVLYCDSCVVVTFYVRSGHYVCRES